MPHMLTSGLELKLERVTARLKAQDIATAMGVHPSRISTIEHEQFPTAATVARYRKAIATCATSQEPAEVV